MTDRGRDVGRDLTEVRTVRTRAENAIKKILSTNRSREREPALYGPPDPDQAEILEALHDVVDRLAPWQRTGRPKKGSPS